MKILSRLYEQIDTSYRLLLANGFRISGHPYFIKKYLRGRNLLLSWEEIFEIATRVRAQPGDLLVFGAGNDSLFWHQINQGHVTAFLESDEYWMKQIRRQSSLLQLHRVKYTSRLSEIRRPETEGCNPPSLDLPECILSREWSSIIVDAPQGWGDGPGRIQSIYEASRLLASNGRIFVHDCDREGERYLVGVYLRKFRVTTLSSRLWLFER